MLGYTLPLSVLRPSLCSQKYPRSQCRVIVACYPSILLIVRSSTTFTNSVVEEYSGAPVCACVCVSHPVQSISFPSDAFPCAVCVVMVYYYMQVVAVA